MFYHRPIAKLDCISLQNYLYPEGLQIPAGIKVPEKQTLIPTYSFLRLTDKCIKIIGLNQCNAFMEIWKIEYKTFGHIPKPAQIFGICYFGTNPIW